MEVSALTNHPTRPVAGLHGRSPLLRLQSDERLITLVRRGNHGAFEELVRRYQARLLSFCRHMLGSREDAEDVLQEVFAAAFNAILADERAINVRPWLYRIARNRSLNHLRRVQAIGVDSMDIHLSEHGTTTADKVDSREAFRELIADVGDLPETQRTALLLREIDALSYEQIAEAMETTIPSVKSLLVRARVSLAEAAEARRLSCDEVRFELGEIAEGLRRRTSPPIRRHLRTCDHCVTFRTELRASSKALAMLLPVGPLLLAKKLLLAHLGLSAGAGGAGGTASGTAALSAAASTATASSTTAGLLSAGIGTVATKAAVGFAAAALMTASAVEIEQRAPRRAPARSQVIAQAPAAVVPHAVVQRAPAHVQRALDAVPPAREPQGKKADPAKAAPPTTDVTTTTVAIPPVAVEEPGHTQVESSTTSLPSTLPAATPVALASPITAPADATPAATATVTIAASPPAAATPPPATTTPPPAGAPPVVVPPPLPAPPAESPGGSTTPSPPPSSDGNSLSTAAETPQSQP